MNDAFTPEEREALDAWDVPALPDDLAERVVPEAPREEAPKPRSKSRRWMALAAGAAAVFAVVWAFDRSAQGEASPSTRTTIAIGDRATAVAEAGSALAWRIGRRGEAVVQQNRGNVFYRVERGGTFEVRVQDKKVRVLGTSFRVEVIEMESKKAALVGAAAGALVATTVVVTVYEGKVVTAAPGGEVTLEAGEAARLTDEGKPKRFAPQLSAKARDKPADGMMARAVVVDEPVVPTDETPEELHQALTKANLENLHLKRELAKVKQELAEAPDERPFFEPSEKMVQRFADDCLVAWDAVSTGVKPPTVPDADVDKVGLTEGEREIADKLLAASHDELKAVIQQTYTAVTGDPNTGSMATEAMFAEITDKTPREVMQQLFLRLSHERAGRLPPPPEGTELQPVERMFRTLTSSGDRLEQAIASELGPDQARKLRQAHNGWNNKSKSSYGCPK
ncbi:MAG: hypothetical protein RMA76_45275 [Deltaproteobacteria bacterium]|jgi:hypothetical protein